MAFTRAKMAGWSLGEKLTSAQQNQIDTNQSRAIDGHAGGTYTPSAPIVIGGSGLVPGMHCAAYELSGTGVTNGSKLTLTEDFSFGGFVLASDEVEVPGNGRYFLSIFTALTNANGSNPAYTILDVLTGATIIQEPQVVRHSTDTSATLYLHASGLTVITDAPTQKIHIKNVSGSDITVQGTYGTLSIVRLS
jgi:hypothetical protein